MILIKAKGEQQMTPAQEKLKHSNENMVPRKCSVEFSNSTYSDEIPEYARLAIGLRIMPSSEEDKNDR